MDMLSSLQTEYIGSMYNLQEIYLFKDNPGTEFYVDAIHIGKNPTTYDVNGMQDDHFNFGPNYNQKNYSSHIVCSML